ncbi:hypothetical protein JOF56_004171 [Kibdelosporangium banguiense]|uniref:Uncharacterized protein n=1 Tax=Kibdelosporangium banguiense TaxID=1365924 RepID=A0ABS4TIX6_9PSEU|nr:hypothetical protein [Kibdelosporangium banguiense]MBP2323786.1 hypothetical protein [Kibdelosporangium banguiense]
MTDWSDKFSSYSLHARMYPAILTVLPVAIAVTVLWPQKPLEALLPAGVSLGVVYFLINVIRARGQRLEKRLVVEWDGMPTTRLLRFRNTENSTLLKRRRAQIEQLFAISLPSREKERRNPTQADEEYVAATRLLIARVRERTSEFPRVYQESTQYGFRRNLLAMKPVGIVMVALSVGVETIYFLLSSFNGRLITSVSTSVVVLLAWLLAVRSDWVRQAGQAYAERLFETLESLTLSQTSEPPSS